MRIFRAKLEELKVELFKKQIFGSIVSYVYVIEFQKRGLPHAHLLNILKTNTKLFAPQSLDETVCVELPNGIKSENLYVAVIKHMMRDPFGELNLNNICMNKKGRCRND